MCDIIKPSFIPPAEIRYLKDLIRYHFKPNGMITYEKNHVQNSLTVSSLTEMYSSTIFSFYYLLSSLWGSFDITPYINSRYKTLIEEIQAVVDGAILPEQAIKLL